MPLLQNYFFHEKHLQNFIKATVVVFPIKYYDIRQAQRHFDNRNIEYHIEFFRCGFNAIVKMWLAGGCKETLEEMKSIILDEYKGRSE